MPKSARSALMVDTGRSQKGKALMNVQNVPSILMLIKLEVLMQLNACAVLRVKMQKKKECDCANALHRILAITPLMGSSTSKIKSTTIGRRNLSSGVGKIKVGEERFIVYFKYFHFVFCI